MLIVVIYTYYSSLYVCIYVCIYVCMYVCMYICLMTTITIIIYIIIFVLGNNLGSQAFFGSLGQKFSPNDLLSFQTYFNVNRQSVAGIYGTGTSTSTCSASTCGEANLDVQYLMAISQVIII